MDIDNLNLLLIFPEFNASDGSKTPAGAEKDTGLHIFVFV
jgi:hypothetical protein